MFPSILQIPRLAALAVVGYPLIVMVGNGQDAGLAAGRPLAPLEVRWKPEMASSPLPGWAPGPVDATAGSAIFQVPALWRESGIDCYAFTVVFEDTEDAGPIVEWRSADGTVVRISEGLGEGDGSLGLHARTVLLPSELTKQGGAVVVSMPWRPGGLVSAAVEPARDVTVAVVGSSLQPGLIDRAGVLEEIDGLDGSEPAPPTGDVRSGPIVEAELAAGIEALGGELEFQVPVDGVVEGAVLRAEVLGLDPASRVDVVVNGAYVGELNSAAFRLDDAAAMIDASGRLTLAGWRLHTLFLPASAWKNGENRVLLRLRRGQASEQQGVSLKNTHLHLRFSAASGSTAGSIPAVIDIQRPAPARNVAGADRKSVTESPVLQADEEPDFQLSDGLISEQAPVPAVVTAQPKVRAVPSPSVVVAPPPLASDSPLGDLLGEEFPEGSLPVER